MNKFVFLYPVLIILAGCSMFEPKQDDKFYNAFEDDFFSGVSRPPTSESYVSDEEVTEEQLYSAEPVSPNDEQNYENTAPVIPKKKKKSIRYSNTGDDYIFSFVVQEGESLKSRLNDLLEPYNYKLIWKSEYDVFFENDVLYEDKLLVNILKGISSDLLKMGIDIHMNVYLKNKVVLVYSVRS